MTITPASAKERAASLALWKAQRQRRREQLADTRRRFDPASRRFVVLPILERHPDVDLVVQECRHFLGESWGFQVVCRPELAGWVRSTIPDMTDIDVFQLDEPAWRDVAWDELLRLPTFWNRLHGDHVLMLDHDTILRSAFPSALLPYDFVAPLQPESWVGPWCRFGTGAVSYQSRVAMLEICESCNTRPAMFPVEGIMFSILLRLHSDRHALPADDLAATFCAERCFHDDPFALHSTWKYLPSAKVRSLLSTDLALPGQTS